tara:strand:+ start:305 stop:466 length:162 start_codon:yes stop_codon:yes gene_type:complete
LADEIGQTVEEFAVQTVSKPGELSTSQTALPGDELPDEVAEWVNELKKAPRRD